MQWRYYEVIETVFKVYTSIQNYKIGQSPIRSLTVVWKLCLYFDSLIIYPNNHKVKRSGHYGSVALIEIHNELEM